MNQVSYQRNQPDAYYHRYAYDAENRITNVYSARDSVMLYLLQPLQEQEAQYTYYNHGPLMNTVLGKLQVQKHDYVYTLQGWLKGINPVMGGTLANGKDTTDAYIYGRDVYGFSLHYYNKDYRAIGTASASTTVLNAMGSGPTQLYNGNIAAMAVTLSPFGGAGQGTRVYNYKYDQLNRLVAMDAHKGLYPAAGTLGTFTDTLLKDYQERVSYDPNGNILTYNRHGDAARLSMDSMTYSYLDTSNKLDKVVDLAADNSTYNDIRTGQANGNYKYDAIGNMTADVKDTVSNITWTVYGKIASLVKSGQTIRYVYDASGNRIMKQTHDDTTAYVRDATGNVLSVYTKQAGGDTVVRSEADIYGSSRLGMATQHIAPDTAIGLQKNLGLGTKTIFTRGEKLFELDNHLGNVLATVSDRKIEIDSDANGIVDSYRADVVSASDYSPGGMLMPARNLIGVNGYRYSINGQEKSPEVSPNNTSAEFWEYDARIVRRWNVDLVNKVWESPYASFFNNPIKFADPNGDDPIGNQYKVKKGDTYTSIAKNSGGKYTVEDLKRWNKGTNPTKLQIGRNINVSDPSKGMDLGSSGTVGTGEDSEVGGGSSGRPAQQPTSQEGVRQLKDYGNNPAQAMLDYVNANKNATLISDCSTDVGEDVAKAVQRFVAGHGGRFSDYSNAEIAFINSSIFADLKFQIVTNFQKAMKEHDGDVSNVSIAGKLVPPYVGTLCKSMLALFGGTQQVDVYLMDITFTNNKTYTASFKGVVWDDYGVSTKDFTTSRGFWGWVGGAQKGLTGMWVLEHLYGHKPLVNGLNFNFTITGSY